MMDINLQNLIDIASVENLETDIPAATLPQGLDVVSLERLQHDPADHRFRVTTDDFDSFIAFCETNKEKGMMSFYNPQAMEVITCFNPGSVVTPEWANRSARLLVDFEDEFDELLKHDRSWIKPEQFADFLIDFEDCIGFSDTAVQKVVAMMSSLKVSQINERVIDHKSSSAMEQIEVSAGRKLPDMFSFTCKPWSHCNEMTFACNLYYRSESGDPRIRYRILKRAQVERDIRNEIFSVLSNKIPGAVYVGHAKIQSDGPFSNKMG